jgi:hypothetical protein
MRTELTDAELDALLARAAPVLPPPAARTAVQLARETAAQRGWRAWWRHRSVRIGAAVGAALVLAGAGTITAYEMSIPPFVGLPPGVVRVRPAIPVKYTDSLGNRVECQAYMELANITDDQYQQLAAISESPMWVGWGDRTLQDLGLTDAPPNVQNEMIFHAVVEEMERQASTVIPDLVIARNSDGPVFNGATMRCEEPDGTDGQP